MGLDMYLRGDKFISQYDMAQSDERGRGCIDEVGAIEHRQRVHPTVGKKGVAGAQHGDGVGHVLPEPTPLHVATGGGRCDFIPTMI